MLPEKANIICLLHILQEYSDEQHILSRNDISQKMSTFYDRNVDRRTIYSCINLLIDLGYDICKYGENGEGYYLRERPFELAEIRVLMDAVYSFPFISQRQSTKLVRKLQETQSCYCRKSLTHLKISRSNIKTHNEQVFFSLEMLDEAIERKRKVRFTYLRYDINKKLVPRRSEKYTVNPYGMVFTNEHYYLVCVMEDKENVSMYRIDRMKEIEITEKPLDDVSLDFNPRGAVEHAIYAFAGEAENIVFVCNRSVLDDVIDRFGHGVFIKELDDQRLEIHIKSSPQGIKFWALQYLPHVEILQPPWLRDEIKESIRNNPYNSEY